MENHVHITGPNDGCTDTARCIYCMEKYYLHTKARVGVTAAMNAALHHIGNEKISLKMALQQISSSVSLDVHQYHFASHQISAFLTSKNVISMKLLAKMTLQPHISNPKQYITSRTDRQI